MVQPVVNLVNHFFICALVLWQAVFGCILLVLRARGAIPVKGFTYNDLVMYCMVAHAVLTFGVLGVLNDII